MSGARGNPAGAAPTPTQHGSSVDQAATNIADILDREDGQSRPAARRAAPARPTAPRAREESPPEEDAETGSDEALADAEGDGPEVEEGEGQEEATAEEEDQGEEDQPASRMFTVKVDGKNIQVDEAELLAGYSRQVDYTRKTMAHAEKERAFEGHAQRLLAEREQYAQLLPALVQQYETMMNPPIDWERLRQENLPLYIQQREIQQDLAARRQAALEEQGRLQAESAQTARVERARLLETEKQALERAMPAWRDPDKWDKARADARRYLTDQGYSDQQISDLTDHRAVVIAWKAAQYDAMLKRGNAVPAASRQPAAPPSAPGANVVRRPTVSQHTRNKQRLAKTHSIRDATAVIAGLL